MILLYSCSLHPESRSRILAKTARDRFADLGEPVEFVDLREQPLPICDGGTTYSDENSLRLVELGQRADAVVLAAPIYNYDVSAATKNLIELTGRSWTGKVVGMLFAAGGQGSYMAGMGMANSLMLDFRCLVIPRYVYADGRDFADDRIVNPDVDHRITERTREVTRVSRALRE